MPYVPEVHAVPVPAYRGQLPFFFKNVYRRKKPFKNWYATNDDEIIWYWGGLFTRHVTIASRPLEKTALRRGPSPVPVRKGGPAYGRSDENEDE